MNTTDTETINHGLKLIAKSSAIVFIGSLLSKLFFYIYRIMIARHYEPKVYGLFALSIMVIGWFRVFSGLGLKQGLLRSISLARGRKEKNKIQYLFTKSFLILIFTSILAGILLFFASEFIALKLFSSPDLIIFLKFFSLVIPLAVLGECLLSVIRAYEKIGWYSFIANILGNLITLSILLFLIFFGVNSRSIPISYLVGSFSIFIAAYFLCRIKLSEIFILDKKIDVSTNKRVFREMFSYSWPFLFYGVVLFVFSWMDSFMIGIFRTVEDVGFYNAAVPLAWLLYLPLSLFGQLFFPLVTKEFSRDKLEVVKQLSQQVGKWIFMVAVPLFVLLMIFPGVFLNLFGPEYLVAKNALRFLSIGALFSALFGISQELLSMKGKSKLILMNTVIAGVINIILNLILVPTHGINGAALATMISLIILNILFFVQSYKHLSIIPFRKKILRITILILISTALLLFVKSFVEMNLLSLVFCGFFFVAIYILLILITRCLDKKDVYVLRSIFSKLKRKRS
jgi:O-antigen/teichoic acid export membrane protein